MSSAISQFDAGSTVFLELSFADRNGVSVTPNALAMQINDVTNGVVVYPKTSISAPASPQTTAEVPIAATLNVMTRPCQLQTNRVIVTATLPDGSIVVNDFPYTLNNPAYLKTTVRA